MVWDITDITTNDIIYQDGVFAYNFTAGEAIKKGQAVYVSADNTVSITTSTAVEADSIGVACYDAANGAQIAIAGPGNIAVACFDAAVAVGLPVYGDTYGVFDETAGSAVKIAGYVVELPVVATTAYVGKLLLV